MKEKDFIKVLQFYRHDLMNYLQIIQGYISMDQYDKVKNEVDKMLGHFSQEKKLLELNAPYFILWMLQVNHIEGNIRVDYHIQDESMNLISIDSLLTEQCKQIINCIKKNGHNFELYEVTINFSIDQDDSSHVNINFRIIGKMDKEKILRCSHLIHPGNPLHIEKTTKGLNCNVAYLIHK